MSQTGMVCRNVDTVSSNPASFAHHAADHSASGAHGMLAGMGKGKRTLLWGISGGTVLSALGFVGLALFEQYNSCLTELRGDLKHFNEISGDLVKKDTLQRYREQLKDMYKEMQTNNAARAQLEQELKSSEHSREEMAREVQQMRERLAYVEGRQAALTTTVSAVPSKK